MCPMWFGMSFSDGLSLALILDCIRRIHPINIKEKIQIHYEVFVPWKELDSYPSNLLGSNFKNI